MSSPANDGWTALFDGRSTAAWRGYNQESFPSDSWVVEDGMLKAIGGAKNPRDLITREKYGSFELELEWKLPPKGNSGVLYRVAEQEVPSWHSGPEMQILDDGGFPSNSPKTWAGALYDLIAPAEGKKLQPVGGWNQMRLLVNGNHVEHWLNAQKLLEYELGSPALASLIAGSKFKDMPRFAREPQGHVALQHHGEGVWFRNVRIRALPSGEAGGAGQAVATGKDWTPLFNGRDLGGWKTHGQERWVVDQGEILGEALTEAYGYLSTEKTYRNFELKAQFKAEGNGNSGVFYHSTIDGVDIKGVQVEVDPHPGKHTGGLYESDGRGWLIKPHQAAEDALRVGGWNEVRALVRGPHVQTWVNGVAAVDYVDPTPKYVDGAIALQLHSGGEGRMRFKDIFVREVE